MPTMTTSALDMLLDDFCVAAARRHPGETLAIAHEIAGLGPQAVSAFVGLLRFRDRRVAIAAAHHLLQLLEPDHAARAEAVRILDGAADLDPAEFAWLESWRCDRSADVSSAHRVRADEDVRTPGSAMIAP